jgi:E3 ubiquitin-protein ligase HECTD3
LEALKNGLESVVSRHILSLHTGFELEKKICGSPEISIEDLKMSSKYLNIFKKIKKFTHSI